MQPNGSEPPFIVVGVPCGTDYVMYKFAHALCMMTAFMAGKVSQMVAFSQSSIVTQSRDNVIAAALAARDQGAPVSHIMFIDNDLSFPPDTALRLLDHEKDIVGAVYMRKIAPFDVHCVPYEMAPNQTSGVYNGLIRARSMAIGCCLIKMEVFDRIRPPWFQIRYDRDASDDRYHLHGEDHVFCEEVQELGYEVWADLDLSDEVVHWGSYGFRQADFEAARTTRGFQTETKKVIRV